MVQDARSLQAKTQLANAMGFLGISAWTLGQEDPAFWASLDAWRVRRPRSAILKDAFDRRSKRAARMLGRGM